MVMICHTPFEVLCHKLINLILIPSNEASTDIIYILADEANEIEKASGICPRS